MWPRGSFKISQEVSSNPNCFEIIKLVTGTLAAVHAPMKLILSLL